VPISTEDTLFPQEVGMFRLVWLAGLVLAAAAFGPYLLSKAPEYFRASGNAAPESTPGEAGAAQSNEPADPPAEQQGAATGKLPPVEGPEVRSLAEVFRFDVSPSWVLARWPQVPTGLAQLQYQGYRVPLVTGTAPDDLAGSLTYYFNAHQQVERIVFRGTTGDARKLVALLMQRYRFVRRLTNDPGIFLYESVQPDRKTKSVLLVRSADIVRADDPNHRFQVDLTLQRPG
jgi:hypothetical protein